MSPPKPSVVNCSACDKPLIQTAARLKMVVKTGRERLATFHCTRAGCTEEWHAGCIVQALGSNSAATMSCPKCERKISVHREPSLLQGLWQAFYRPYPQINIAVSGLFNIVMALTGFCIIVGLASIQMWVANPEKEHPSIPPYIQKILKSQSLDAVALALGSWFVGRCFATIGRLLITLPVHVLWSKNRGQHSHGVIVQ